MVVTRDMVSATRLPCTRQTYILRYNYWSFFRYLPFLELRRWQDMKRSASSDYRRQHSKAEARPTLSLLR